MTQRVYIQFIVEHRIMQYILLLSASCALFLFIRSATPAQIECDPCQVLGLLDAKEELYVYSCPNSTIQLRKFGKVGYSQFDLRVYDVTALLYHLVLFHYEKNAPGPLRQPTEPFTPQQRGVTEVNS